MYKLWIILLLQFGYLKDTAADHEIYQGHQIWKIDGPKEEMRAILPHLVGKYNLDIFDEGTLRVPKEQRDLLKNDLEARMLKYDVIVKNLKEYLEEEEGSTRRSRSSVQSCEDVQGCDKLITDEWMSLKQINNYIGHLKTNFSQKMEVTSIGKSIEGNDIWLVHVKRSDVSCSEERPLKTVWIEGGVHAREWISHITALHIIESLKNDCELLRGVEFFIAPMGNPDGYSYSKNKERFWRKNRRINDGSPCVGVDLNRNWDFKYGVGASDDPCSDVYKGTAAFSEPETLSLSNAMKKIPNIDLVISLHSYGGVLLYPYGHTTDPAPNINEMKLLGEIFKAAIKKETGSDYSVKNSAAGLYFASGATDDWSKGVLGVKHAYTLELPPQSFIVPANDILKYSKEAWHGIKSMVDDLKK